jgi:hypothetical protein
MHLKCHGRPCSVLSGAVSQATSPTDARAVTRGIEHYICASQRGHIVQAPRIRPDQLDAAKPALRNNRKEPRIPGFAGNLECPTRHVVRVPSEVVASIHTDDLYGGLICPRSTLTTCAEHRPQYRVTTCKRTHPLECDLGWYCRQHASVPHPPSRTRLGQDYERIIVHDIIWGACIASDETDAPPVTEAARDQEVLALGRRDPWCQ